MSGVSRCIAAAMAALLLAAACASGSRGSAERKMAGLASWYGEEYAGRTTANGEIFDPKRLTAAHRTLPFGTIVKVTNQTNGQSVNVRINDRGPFINSRIIDVSWGAAKILDIVDAGVAPVEIDVVKLGAGDREPPVPYVVEIKPPPAAPQRSGVPPAEPPDVPFPLPTPSGVDAPAPDDGFTVEVIEESASGPMRKQVASDGETVERVPLPPSETPSDGTGERYVLQLGAFQIEQNARELKQKAGAITGNVFIETSEGLHRVRVGPFDSKVTAIEMRETLEMAGFPTLLLALD